MTRIARLNDDNTIASILDPAEAAPGEYLEGRFVLVSSATPVGARYDAISKTFKVAQTRRRWITRLAFRQRMTGDERLTLKQAQLLPTREAGESDSAYAARCAGPLQLQDMNDLLADATYIDLDRTDTRQMVQLLEAASLLAAGRALEILDAPIADHEYHPEA